MQFTWDETKNLANQAKHGVRFEQAHELFLSGDDYVEVFDEANSDAEDRFIAIGPVKQGIILVVWTERDEDTVRIISARWATPAEQQRFHAHMEGTGA
jgi:uncharacterized DUF497 family protein